MSNKASRAVTTPDRESGGVLHDKVTIAGNSLILTLFQRRTMV